MNLTFLTDPAALDSLYPDAPAPASLRKVADRLSHAYARWIARSRFCILSTVGPEGTDASPRGDDGPVVLALDARHLALPDWRGNNRIDSLKNILRDDRVSLMFLVAGSQTVVRVNGRARISADDALRARFDAKGPPPRSVIVVQIGEVYFQCARAILRAGLWTRGDDSAGLPTPGEILAELTEGTVGGAAYDAAWPARAAATLW